MLTGNLLGAFTDVVPNPWLQLTALVLLIAVIVGFVMYRRKQR